MEKKIRVLAHVGPGENNTVLSTLKSALVFPLLVFPLVFMQMYIVYFFSKDIFIFYTKLLHRSIFRE